VDSDQRVVNEELSLYLAVLAAEDGGGWVDLHEVVTTQGYLSTRNTIECAALYVSWSRGYTKIV
jgi:hypothetical protein